MTVQALNSDCLALRVGSVCSGIGAPECAWQGLSWHSVFASEIAAFPRAVFGRRFPSVPIHGDFTTIEAGTYGPIDLLVGGTPCQSFSVAGLRGGMADERGNLALEFLRLADRLNPRWVVWENVPGVLSSNSGRDFGSFLGGLGQLGYGFAYRVLDAQHFGVAQRRRRVFVVGYLGDWRRAAAVLFERASLCGYPAPRREAGKDVAATVGTRASKGTDDLLNDGGLQLARCLTAHPNRIDGETETFITSPTLRAQSQSSHRADSEAYVTATLTSNGDAHSGFRDDAGLVTHTLRGDGFDASEDGTGRGTPQVAVSFTCSEQANSFAWEREVYPTLSAQIPNDTSNIQQGIRLGSSVRRLTPRECERLQGFPDVKSSVTIRVWCSEQLKASALAETQNLKSQQSVLNAVESECPLPAWPVGERSTTPHLAPETHAALLVRVDLERGDLQIRSRERLLWSAGTAEIPSSSPLSMPLAAFVRLLALMPQTLGSGAIAGVEASRQNTTPSTPRRNGSGLVHLCGQEIAGLVADAAKFTETLNHFTKSTTSAAAPSSQNLGWSLETWSCCVAAAIASCIPEGTRAGSSFDLRVETSTGWTAVPYRGKPAADGPRYKAIGNSMAVPVLGWIGERIARVDALTEVRDAA